MDRERERNRKRISTTAKNKSQWCTTVRLGPHMIKHVAFSMGVGVSLSRDKQSSTAIITMPIHQELHQEVRPTNRTSAKHKLRSTILEAN